MRFATSSFILAAVLFLGGATSFLGGWSVAAACVLFLIAAVAGAVAMEERDLAGAEGLLPGRADATDAEPPRLDAVA
jgi:hypothetical protein